MAENSGIAWTTHTFNPWVGCTKVGPGCDGCYAAAWDARFDGGHWGPGAPRRRTSPAIWAKVRKWNRDAATSPDPVWVFCASLADIFDNEADSATRADVWSLASECQNLHFQFVTKRIGNAFKMMPSYWGRDFAHCGVVATVVTQEECDRDLPKLLELKRAFGIAWVGLSIEPQLELVLPRDAIGLDWIITGGESAQRGHEARPYDLHWTRALISFGKEEGVAIFVKQLGSNAIDHVGQLPQRHRAGADPNEWPADIRVREMPRAA